MPRFARCVFAVFLAVSCLSSSLTCQAAAPETAAAAFVLMEAGSGRVLAARNETQERSIASTTKIMTCLVALEHSELTEKVTVKREHLREGSSMYLLEGETLTMEELLYGLMLPSGNDAAEALADGCGGTASFVRRMNGLARELGLASLREEGQLFSSLNAVSLLVQLTVLFARQALSADRPADAQGPDHRELLRYMYLHCGQKLTLQQLADVFGCSRSTVSARITAMTGLSFFDLLNEMRIGKTADYLLYTDLTLKELAEILGYVDESHISKVFAARLGTRIGQYRATYQKVQNICQLEESRLGCSLVNHIYRHYREDLSAAGVARSFGISVQQLNRTLLCQVEQNFEDFLAMVRVNRACQLLTTTRMTVLDIALEVGYHNAKTLNRSFLKYRLMTPSAYRAAAQPGA